MAKRLTVKAPRGKVEDRITESRRVFPAARPESGSLMLEMENEIQNTDLQRAGRGKKDRLRTRLLLVLTFLLSNLIIE